MWPQALGIRRPQGLGVRGGCKGSILRALRGKKALPRGCGQMRHVANAWVVFGGFMKVKRRVFNVGMVLGSQGSPDGSSEGFRGSPGEIWSPPRALWGMFGGPLWIKRWSKALQILQDALCFG